jgi:radical SAM protein with 4Fe4S-binding SPASM domain
MSDPVDTGRKPLVGADGGGLELPPGCAVVAVMARPLVRGAVKRRLAASVGDDEALAVYARLLGGTLAAAARVAGAELVLAESEGRAESGAEERADGADPAAAPLLGSDGRWRRLRQRGGALGERLAAVFDDLFAAGAARAIIVGSDSPSLPAEYLERGLALLAGATDSDTLVLGPAADGGYYLIGVAAGTWRRRRQDLFAILRDTPTSTSGLLSATIAAARRAGVHVRQLPLWVDVDHVEDLGLMERLAGRDELRGRAGGTLREIYLHVTHRCARDCRHCYDRGAESGAGELATPEWKDVVDQCAGLGARSFVFIGGDPLLRADFVELVEHITGAHAARARFFFNSLIDEETAARLAHAGHGRLTPLASIDGPRAINDALRGPGSYDDVMASIATLRAEGLEPVANTVLVRPALAGLPQLARELRAAGVGRLHLILPHQHGGLPDDLELVPTGDELLVAVRALVAVAAQVGLTVDNLASWRRRLGARNDLCAAGCRDLAVDPYGSVHACVITAGDPAFVAGSVREQTVEQIWRTSSSLRLLRAARARDRAACAACPVVDACGGECWVQAHYAARAHDEPAGYAAAFPYCGLVRPVFEELAAEPAASGSSATDAASAQAGACAATACGGQAAAGADDYALFDCI